MKKAANIDVGGIIDAIKRIKKVKSNRQVAQILDVSENVLATSKSRNTFSAEARDRLLEFCRDEDISFDNNFAKYFQKDAPAKTYESLIDTNQNNTKITNNRGENNKQTIDIWVYSLKRKGRDGNFLPVEKLGIPDSDYNEYIIAYRNPGREMGEVIPSGSIVAINTKEREPISGEIYLFRFHYRGKEENKQFTYVIRRVQVKKGGRGLILLSDNSQLYPPLELDPEDINDDTIMGRVMIIHGRRYLYDDLLNKTG